MVSYSQVIVQRPNKPFVGVEGRVLDQDSLGLVNWGHTR